MPDGFERSADSNDEDLPAHAQLAKLLDATIRNLALDSLQKYQSVREPIYLERGIQAMQLVVDTVNPTDPHFAASVNGLAAGLYERHALYRNLSDLDQAVQLLKVASGAARPKTPESREIAKNLYVASAELAYELLGRNRPDENAAERDRAYEIARWICEQTRPISPTVSSPLRRYALRPYLTQEIHTAVALKNQF